MSNFPKFKFFIYLVIGVCLSGFAFLYLIPAFRGDIEVQPDINLGPVRIHVYGLLMALGILMGYLVSRKSAPKFGLDAKHLENVLPWLVIFGILGARAYFVFFSWEYYGRHLGEIWQFWKGGWAIYGAILGGLAGSCIYSLKNKIVWENLANLLVIGLPLAQAIGRFGNFFNQEAFGYPTNLPWKMYVSVGYRPLEYLREQYFHPAFLYEAVWDLIVFFILLCLTLPRGNRKGRINSVLGVYLVLYPVGRFFIEFLRVDSFFWAGARVDQLASLFLIAIGVLLILRNEKKNSILDNY